MLRVIASILLITGLIRAGAGGAGREEGAAVAAGRISEQELVEANRPLPPLELQAAAGRKSFDLKGEPRKLIEEVAKAYGLDVIFDNDYQPVTPLRFRIEDAGYREAIRAVEAATDSFLTPASERLALVSRDTPQKRQEVESTMAVTVPIPTPVAVQEAQELARSVQGLMEIQRFVVDSERRLALIRDRISKVRPAQRVFEQLLHHRPQVSIEVDFLEVFENSNLSYGLRLQTEYPLVWLSRIWNSVRSIPEGITRLATFGGGRTFFGLGLMDAELFASMSRSSARTLLKSEMRTVDGQAATLHVGDRYPIITAGYFGQTDTTGQVYAPPPTFNFEDLGVVLKVTPHVHGMEEVTLEVEAEFKVLTGQALNGIPVIANRKFQSAARLRMDEWAILAGLVRSSDSKTRRGIPILSRLPLVGALFRQNDRSKEGGQTLLVLKPKLLNLPPTEVVTGGIWTGTESRPRAPL